MSDMCQKPWNSLGCLGNSDSIQGPQTCVQILALTPPLAVWQDIQP